MGGIINRFMSIFLNSREEVRRGYRSESDYIVGNLEKAYNINKKGQLTTFSKPNQLMMTAILLRDGTLPLFGNFETPIPLDLRMEGLQAVHNFEEDVSYLYSIQENKLISLCDGDVTYLKPPTHRLVFWKDMDKYISELDDENYL